MNIVDVMYLTDEKIPSISLKERLQEALRLQEQRSLQYSKLKQIIRTSKNAN